MAIRSLAQLKAWFQRGLYPTSEQFSDQFDSFYHKEGSIPIDGVAGLSDAINSKYNQTSGEELEQDVASISEMLTQHAEENQADFNAVNEVIAGVKSSIPALFTFDYTAYIAEGDSGPMHDIALQIYSTAQAGNPAIVNVRNVYTTVNATQILAIETGLLNIIEMDDNGVSAYVDGIIFNTSYNESDLLVGTFWAIKMIFNDDMTDVQVVAVQRSSELMTEEAVRSLIPPIPEPIVYDVTDMFENPSNAQISVFMKGSLNGQRVVEFYAEDDTGIEAPLTLTAAFGFGPKKSTGAGDLIVVNDSTGNLAEIDLVAETATAQGTITIPVAVKRISGISYIIGDSGAPKKSYYVDTDGVYHAFSAANTPLVNFCFNGQNNDSIPIIVEGASVQRDTIMSIVFGEDYNSNETIAPGFLRVFNSLKKSDISSIGNSCSQIGINFLSWSIQNQELDISKFTILNSIGRAICYNNYNLKTIRIGSVDFSNISVDLDLAFGLIPNESTRSIYADTQELADALKEKYPMLSNWSVVVNL